MNLRILVVIPFVIGAVALKSTFAAPAQQPLDIPTNMKPYFLVTMLKGPNFKDPTTPEGMKVIGEHLAWIRRMNKEKKLFLAGPTSGGKALGVSVMAGSDIAEIRKLMDEEPAVKAGSMTYEVQSVRFPSLDAVKFEYAK